MDVEHVKWLTFQILFAHLMLEFIGGIPSLPFSPCSAILPYSQFRMMREAKIYSILHHLERSEPLYLASAQFYTFELILTIRLI